MYCKHRNAAIVFSAIIATIAVFSSSPACAQTSRPPLEPARLCPIDNRWYSISNQADSWWDGVAVASNSAFNGRRGHLAVVTDTRVRSWIVSQYGKRTHYVYIGGYRASDDSATQGWIWYDPTQTTPWKGIPAPSSSWAPGEPNNFKGKERYLAMDLNNGGLFADIGDGAQDPKSSSGPYPHLYLVQY
jgi:hypothetical protein